MYNNFLLYKIMINYNVLFYLYLSLVCLLLSVFAFFVSLQLKFVFLYLLKYLDILKLHHKNSILLHKNYKNFYSFYLLNFNYFFCISLSEFYLEKKRSLVDKKSIYLALSFIYIEVAFWEIAEYYYLQALSLQSDNCDICVALGNMYLKLGYEEDAQTFYLSQNT